MKISKNKKIILSISGAGILIASIVTPIVVLNQNKEKDVEKIMKILTSKKQNNTLIINLQSDATGNIIENNKLAIEKELRKLVDSSNSAGDVNHSSLLGTTIEVSMIKDGPISTTPKDIIVTISKDGETSVTKNNIFKVKREHTPNEAILEAKNILDRTYEDDLTIIIPSDSSGNIIGNNKKAIEEKIKKLIGINSRVGGQDPYWNIKYLSLKEVKIEVSMTTDAPISTTPQVIIVELSKVGGTSQRTTKIFKVKRDYTPDESIAIVKAVLDGKNESDLIITLPSDRNGKIIENFKLAIERKLRKLVDSSNSNGDPNDPSLFGTTIEISMISDQFISTISQEIIVTISKTGGTSQTTTKIFKVKRGLTDQESFNRDILKINAILNRKSGDDLIITIPSNSTGNIIANNKQAIEKELMKLVDSSNSMGETNHPSLLGTTIQVSMTTDAPISTIPQNIIVKISKNGEGSIITNNVFKVKRLFTENELVNSEINVIKRILDTKVDVELIITLPSNSTGNIIGNNANKQAIEKELMKLVDSSNSMGDANHPSLFGTTIQVSMTTDAPISKDPQNIIVTISKSGGISQTTTKIFKVKRQYNSDELIIKIKGDLEEKSKNGKTIILPSNSTGNIIGNSTNKIAIEKELMKLVEPLNKNGDPNHPSLFGTTIEISMNTDAPISTTAQDIIVTISKSGGTNREINNKFKVKKDYTPSQSINEVKKILDGKSGNDLIIILPSNSKEGIVSTLTNKNAVEKKLRKLVDPSNLNGNADHPSLLGTTIQISMTTDQPISTNEQNIIVTISKIGSASQTTTKIFKVKREYNPDESINKVKTILEEKSGDDLIITIPSNSTGNIIGNNDNKLAIEKELRKLIDSSNLNGDANHPSLFGTTIEVSMTTDAQISTIEQNIIVTISKSGGTSQITTKTFKVKREYNPDESINNVKTILEKKSGNDLIITLASDANGNIIGNSVNKIAIEKELRKLVDPSNLNGDANHPSLFGTTIEISMTTDAPISTSEQNIIVKISKSGGTSQTTTKVFKVKKE